MSVTPSVADIGVREAKPNKCTVEQVLKLKELKMTDQRVKAACE